MFTVDVKLQHNNNNTLIQLSTTPRHWSTTRPPPESVINGKQEQVPETKIAEFANSEDLDEVAHNEPLHQDLHCLPSKSLNSQ